MNPEPKYKLIREWIVFALCLGLGGHVALAIVLHAPERWPWSHAGMYGLLIGLGIYLATQAARSLWWVLKNGSKSVESDSSSASVERRSDL